MVTAPPRFEGKHPRSWLAQISCYYNSLGVDAEERLEDVAAFLIGKALLYWCSIMEHAPDTRPRSWEDFAHLMMESFGGQTIGSTIANLQKLRYNGGFELLAEQLADVLAEEDDPPPDLTLDLFLSRFPIEMVKPILEEKFSNWVQARARMRDIRASKQEGC